jgi:hypothetical protein
MRRRLGLPLEKVASHQKGCEKTETRLKSGDRVSCGDRFPSANAEQPVPIVRSSGTTRHAGKTDAVRAPSLCHGVSLILKGIISHESTKAPRNSEVTFPLHAVACIQESEEGFAWTGKGGW